MSSRNQHQSGSGHTLARPGGIQRAESRANARRTSRSRTQIGVPRRCSSSAPRWTRRARRDRGHSLSNLNVWLGAGKRGELTIIDEGNRRSDGARSVDATCGAPAGARVRTMDETLVSQLRRSESDSDPRVFEPQRTHDPRMALATLPIAPVADIRFAIGHGPPVKSNRGGADSTVTYESHLGAPPRTLPTAVVPTIVAASKRPEEPEHEDLLPVACTSVCSERRTGANLRIWVALAARPGRPIPVRMTQFVRILVSPRCSARRGRTRERSAVRTARGRPSPASEARFGPASPCAVGRSPQARYGARSPRSMGKCFTLRVRSSSARSSAVAAIR